mgnify:CR=1 FL=1
MHRTFTEGIKGGSTVLIGVVADTHMPSRAKTLPQALVSGLKGVDLILHAGDWTDLAVADMIGRIAPVDGVAGDKDGYDIVAKFRRSKILTLNGYRIGIVHGDGFAGTADQRAWIMFRNAGVNAILFGHSHIPFMEKRDGVLLFNPGSPTDKRAQPKYSYGIWKLGYSIEARHYYYDDKSGR